MRRYLKSFLFVIKHKWDVLMAGKHLGGIPIWQLLMHDRTKFLPREFIPTARAYYTPDGISQYQPDDDFEAARWLHENRQKHHWQRWVFNNETRAMPMPERYCREMMADWIAVRNLLGPPFAAEWYEINEKDMVIHPDTKAYIEAHWRAGYGNGW